MKVIVEAQGLTEQYGETLAIGHLDLIFESEIIGLLDPNGAGKTIIKRLLIGQTKFLSGC